MNAQEILAMLDIPVTDDVRAAIQDRAAELQLEAYRLGYEQGHADKASGKPKGDPPFQPKGFQRATARDLANRLDHIRQTVAPVARWFQITYKGSPDDEVIGTHPEAGDLTLKQAAEMIIAFMQTDPSVTPLPQPGDIKEGVSNDYPLPAAEVHVGPNGLEKIVLANGATLSGVMEAQFSENAMKNKLTGEQLDLIQVALMGRFKKVETFGSTKPSLFGPDGRPL